MYKKIIVAAMLAYSTSLYAGIVIEPERPLIHPSPWFASVGAGYSWTQKPGIVNPDPAAWDFSEQGYDSPLGDRGFYSLEVGKKVHPYFDLSLSYLHHERFNYQKFQTGTSNTIDFSGNSRHRFFDLNNRALLLNAFIHTAEPFFSMANIAITPFAGVGIGYARNTMTNFHTVSTVIINGTPVGSTGTIGAEVNTNSFAWQGSAGVNINANNSPLSVDVGYRYLDGGKFEGPNRIFTNNSGFLNAAPWSGHVKANQLFVALKYTFL